VLTSSVICTSKATMVRAEPTSTRTAGIDTSYLTRFTIVLVSWSQRYIWTKLNMAK